MNKIEGKHRILSLYLSLSLVLLFFAHLGMAVTIAVVGKMMIKLA